MRHELMLTALLLRYITSVQNIEPLLEEEIGPVSVFRAVMPVAFEGCVRGVDLVISQSLAR